jgi:hypothetical protein
MPGSAGHTRVGQSNKPAFVPTIDHLLPGSRGESPGDAVIMNTMSDRYVTLWV